MVVTKRKGTAVRPRAAAADEEAESDRQSTPSQVPGCLVNLRRVKQLSRYNARHICEIAGLRDVPCMGRNMSCLSAEAFAN